MLERIELSLNLYTGGCDSDTRFGGHDCAVGRVARRLAREEE